MFSPPSEFLWLGNSSSNTRRKRRKQPKVPPASPICQHLSLPWAAPCSCCGPRQLFYNFISFPQQPESTEQLGLACPHPAGSPQTQGPMGKQIDGATTLKCWRRCQTSERTSAVREATRLQISRPRADPKGFTSTNFLTLTTFPSPSLGSYQTNQDESFADSMGQRENKPGG